MKLFCDICDNLLYVSTNNNVLHFRCNTCHLSYKSTDDDTLRYEETNDKNLVIFNKILDKATKDPVNIKVYKNCPKCKHNIATNVRIGKDLSLINICQKCEFQWVDI